MSPRDPHPHVSFFPPMHFTPPATPANVAALSALAASPTLPPQPPVSNVVSEIFHLCRHAWIHNFLFSTDMAPLSALTAPVNINAAVSCSVSFANVHQPSSPRCSTSPSPNPNTAADVFNMSAAGQCVFVPAFAVGPISVGFGIQCVQLLSGSPIHASMCALKPDTLTHFRFVRDDDASVLLAVVDNHESDIITIDYMKNLTTSTRRRAFLSISRSAFFAACSSTTPPPLSSIILCESITESRVCPQCNAPGGAWCPCKLPKFTPRHPFDFEGTKHSMMLHTGLFSGVANAHFCPAGPSAISAKVGSRVEICGGSDTDLISRFTQWAIHDNISSRSNPIAQILPPPGNALLGHLDDVDDRSMCDASPCIPFSSSSARTADPVITLAQSLIAASSAPSPTHQPPKTSNAVSDVSSLSSMLAEVVAPAVDPSTTAPTFATPTASVKTATPASAALLKTEPASSTSLLDAVAAAATAPSSLLDAASTPQVSFDGTALTTAAALTGMDVPTLIQQALCSSDNSFDMSPAMSFDNVASTSVDKSISLVRNNSCQPLETSQRKNSSTSPQTTADGIDDNFVMADDSMDHHCSPPHSQDEGHEHDERDDRHDLDSHDDDEDNKNTVMMRAEDDIGSPDGYDDEDDNDDEGELDDGDDGTARIAADALKAFRREKQMYSVVDSMSVSRPSTGVYSKVSKSTPTAPLVLPRPIVATTPSIVPLMPTTRTVHARLGVTSDRNLERERRAQLRRQRNREAAQRSNLRRKMRNDSLKQNLRESQTRAAELRARELILREENLKLRKMLPSG